MDLYLLTLRVLHIGAGVAWVGAAWFFFGFLEPTAHALGPDSQRFMHHVIARRRLVRFFVWTSTITVAAGVLLYWRISNGLDPSWVLSSAGIGFTVGGIAATIAWLTGLFIIAPATARIDRLGEQMAGAGRPPTPEEMAAFGALDRTLGRTGRIDVVLLAIAVLGMAVGRYLG